MAWFFGLQWASDRSRYESSPVREEWGFDDYARDGNLDKEIKKTRDFMRYIIAFAAFCGSTNLLFVMTDPETAAWQSFSCAISIIALLFAMSFCGTKWYEKGWQLFSGPCHISRSWSLWASSLAVYAFLGWGLSLPIAALFAFLRS